MAPNFVDVEVPEPHQQPGGRPGPERLVVQIMDTRLAAIRSDLLFLYSCIADARLHQAVSECPTVAGRVACSAALMNLVGGATVEYPPLRTVPPSNIRGWGPGLGLSAPHLSGGVAPVLAEVGQCLARMKALLSSGADFDNLRIGRGILQM